MRRRILTAVLLVLLAVAYIIVVGDHYVVTVDHYLRDVPKDGFKISLIQDREVVKVNNVWAEGSELYVDIDSVQPGTAEIRITGDLSEHVVYAYVHWTGVITTGSYFGNSSGGIALFYAVIVYMIYLTCETVIKLRKNLKEDFYSYKNVTYFGISIFLVTLILYCALLFFPVKSLSGIITLFLGTSTLISFFAIPVAFLITIIVGISNVVLLIREGRSRNNVMGVVACVIFSIALIFPRALDEFLQFGTTLIDVHKETGWGHLFEELVVNILTTVLTYMLFILIGTMVMTIGSAVRKAHTDRDYIIILGCKVRKDGTLPPLLRGRADAAIKFAARQKAASGKDIIFVPSGGQGSDETVSEAEAIASYLRSKGISDDRIIVEDRSTNTRENFQNSIELIKAHGGEDAGIAFATSNYHVLRSGFTASKLGINAEGVGSRTRWYFWLNALIRELIATLHYERRLHLKFLGATLTLVILMVLFNFATLLF